MLINSTLAYEATAFADALDIRPARDGQEQGAQLPHRQQGDTVSISEEARALAAPEQSGQAGKSRSQEKQEQLVQQLKDRIEQLEQEIKEIEKGDLPEKQKLSRLMDKQAQLMELRDQLVKAQADQAKMAGLSAGGGTRATGFGNSLGTF